jgi:hypothetical protein
VKYRVMKHTYTFRTPKTRATGYEGEHDEMTRLAAELQAQPWTPVAVDERRPIYTVEPVPVRPN